MKKVEFAFDAPMPGAVEQVLDWMQANPELTYWAVVDGAFIKPELLDAYTRFHGWKRFNSLALTRLAAYDKLAPQLILVPSDPESRSSNIQALLNMTAKSPSLSWWGSEYPVEALQRLAGWLAIAQKPDEPKALYCRFADLRCLPDVLDTLSIVQQLRIADVVQRLGWLNRQGEWQEWHTKPALEEAPDKDNQPLLRLTLEQADKLLRHNEADRLHTLIRGEAIESLPQVSGSEIHRVLQGHLHSADDLLITQSDDRYQFVLLCLNYGEHFHRCEQLAPTWQTIREQGTPLSTLSAAWSDEIKAALRAQGEQP